MIDEEVREDWERRMQCVSNLTTAAKTMLPEDPMIAAAILSAMAERLENLAEEVRRESIG